MSGAFWITSLIFVGESERESVRMSWSKAPDWATCFIGRADATASARPIHGGMRDAISANVSSDKMTLDRILFTLSRSWCDEVPRSWSLGRGDEQDVRWR